MALKKLRVKLVTEGIDINQQEVSSTPKYLLNNQTANEDDHNTLPGQQVQEVGETIKQVVAESKSNFNPDAFFNDNDDVEEGGSTPITGLEISIAPQELIAEKRYSFSVRNINIDKEVETQFGIKDKLVLDFHISRIEDEKEISYNLKQKFNISNSRRSSFYGVYKDLTGEEPIGNLNLRNLLGIKGKCEVKHILMDNGDIFPKIVNINAQRKKLL